MITFTFGAHELGNARTADFPQVVDALKGRSIISLGEWEQDNRFEFGLSGNLMLRIFSSGANLEINCISTQNRNEPLASALLLGDMPGTVSVWQLEAKLRGLRTAFAIFYLLETSRQEELSDYLRHHPFGDIDRALLAPEDQLQIESVSYGSWVATVRTKARAAFNALIAVGTIVFPRTRDAFLKKLEAEASIKDTRARQDEVALARERFELTKDRTDYALDLAKKIGDEEVQDILRRRLRRAVYELASGDPDEGEIRKLAQKTFSGADAGKDDEE
ncbi:MAG: hypothetical protein ACRD5M_10070 [Candidatus Acidiferrales bacterium]